MSDKPKETKPDEEETSPPVPELVDLRDEVEIYCDGRSAPDDKDDDGLSSNDEEEFLDALDREVRELEEAGIAMGDRHAMTVEETERELKLSAEEFEKDRKEEEEGKFGEEEGARAVEVEEEAETEARRKREEAMTEEEREHLKSEAAALKKEGNELYGSDRSEEAIDKYTEALEKCPLSFQEERAVFAANRAAAKFRLKRFEDALEDCHLGLRLKPDYLKVYARRGQIYEELDKPHEAMKDFEKVLEMDKDHKEARMAVQRLPAKITQKDEEIKQEMFANLKKLGNMVLNPFGLSTENFNFVQDPNTGSYSVNFNQNPQSKS